MEENENVYCSSKLSSISSNKLIENPDESHFTRSYRFRNNSQWINGLNPWLINEMVDSSRTNEFDEDLRIFYPKENVSPLKDFPLKVNEISSSLIDRTLPPRLQDLIEKQFNDYLHHNYSRILPEENFISISPELKRFSIRENSLEEKKEKKSKLNSRLPLRSIRKDPLTSDINVDPIDQSFHSNHQENYSKLFQEQLNSLIPYSRKSSLHLRKLLPQEIPSNNSFNDDLFSFSSSSFSSFDSKLILERYEKLQRLLIQPIEHKPTAIPHYRNSSLTSSSIYLNSVSSSNPSKTFLFCPLFSLSLSHWSSCRFISNGTIKEWWSINVSRKIILSFDLEIWFIFFFDERWNIIEFFSSTTRCHSISKKFIEKILFTTQISFKRIIWKNVPNRTFSRHCFRKTVEHVIQMNSFNSFIVNLSQTFFSETKPMDENTFHRCFFSPIKEKNDEIKSKDDGSIERKREPKMCGTRLKWMSLDEEEEEKDKVRHWFNGKFFEKNFIHWRKVEERWDFFKSSIGKKNDRSSFISLEWCSINLVWNLSMDPL